MSTAVADPDDRELARPAVADRSGDRRLVLLSLWFFATLLLSAFWPEPAIQINDTAFHADIQVDEHAFFGREAFQWDAAMWFLVGLPFLALFHGRTRTAAETYRRFRHEDVPGLWKRIRGRIRRIGAAKMTAILVAGAAFLALVWMAGDVLIVGWLSSVPETLSNVATRPINRLGDGLILSICILFIGSAGAAFGRREWMREALAMVITSAAAGLIMSALKPLIGRVRPEVWTSPLDFVAGSESFPSGHSLYASALAVILLMSGVHRRLSRYALAAFAGLVPLARIVNFRHWPSDVLASVLLVTLVAWIVVPATVPPHAEADASPPL